MDQHDQWFDGYWANLCNEAAHNSQTARSLYKELIGGLRTGKTGGLSHPDVRKFLAAGLEAALEAPPAKVGSVMGINRRTKIRNESHFGDAKHQFALWFCEEQEKNGKEPKRKNWPGLDKVSKKGVSESTLDKWVKYAREILPVYIMFKDVN